MYMISVRNLSQICPKSVRNRSEIGPRGLGGRGVVGSGPGRGRDGPAATWESSATSTGTNG